MNRRNAGIVINMVAALLLVVPAVAGAQSTAKPAVDITLASKPMPATTGNNTFDVTTQPASR